MTQWAERVATAARAALAPVEGELRLPGLREPAEVIRDRWGVPHIYAGSEADLFRAQGFIVASDRQLQLDVMCRIGNGRLAELFSELTLPLDRFIRTMGWNRVAARLTERRGQAELDALIPFVEGQLAWAETAPAPAPEYVVLEAEPFVPASVEEALVWGAGAQVVMAFTLSRNWDIELLRAAIAERLDAEAVQELFPDLPFEPGVVQGNRRAASPLDLLRAASPELTSNGGQGSNNWVVAGSRTASGKPLLANDPHLLVQLPSIWYEVHLVCPTMNVSGVALPFAPGVVIGHNERIAWGFTNTEGDVQDLYLERLNDDGTAALYDGAWEPVTVHREELSVRGRSAPEVLEVRETRHGPILDSYLVGIANTEVVTGGLHDSYAYRWVGAEHGISLEAVLGIDRARTFDEFRLALAGWSCPGQNMVYADVDGNIGYQLTGLYPRRRRGDGSVPVPGWTSDFEWDGFVPFEELPWSFNPEQGFIVTANNRMVDHAYPHVITRDWMPPHRARRIAERLTATPRHTAETFAAMQMDTVSLTAREVLPHLRALEPAGDRQKEALALLEEWDGDLGADSAAAALYQVWTVRFAEHVLRPRLGEELYRHYFAKRHWAHTFRHQVLPELLTYPTARWFGAEGPEARDRAMRAALEAAIEELTARLGEDPAAWRWGAIHEVRFSGRLAIIPDLADLFTAGAVEMGGDDNTVCQALYEPQSGYGVAVIPSWRQVMDLGDPDASLGAHPPGQSGNPASPHFADLLPLWAEGRGHPLPLSRPGVEEIAATTLTLAP